MIISGIKIKNFRNIEAAELEFASRFNLFLGENAQGKTNLLEAIFFVSALRSFRNKRASVLIREGAEVASIEAQIERSGSTYTTRVVISKDGRRLWLNGKVVKKPEDYYGLIKAVVFVPDDLLLIKGEPKRRRRFLDSIVFQIKPSYAKLLSEFSRALKERNALLARGVKEFADPLMLAYTRSVCKLGSQIAAERLRIVEGLKPFIQSFIHKVSSSKEDISIRYISGISKDLPQDPLEIEELFLNVLRNDFAAEQRRTITLHGPQKDDFVLLLNGKPMSVHASQGQHRSAVVALKAAQMNMIATLSGIEPVLLLDDLSSELDLGRRSRLFEALLGAGGGQMFLTTTESRITDLLPRSHSKVFSVMEGNIEVMK